MAAPGLCQGSQGAVWILGWTMLSIWKPIQNLKTSICLLLQIYNFFFQLVQVKLFCILLLVTFPFEIGMLLQIGYCTPKPLVSLPVLTKPGPCSERPSVGLAVPLPRYLIQILVVHSYNSTISTQDIVSNLRVTNLACPSVLYPFSWIRVYICTFPWLLY